MPKKSHGTMVLLMTVNIKYGLWQDVHTSLKECSPICTKIFGGERGAQGHTIILSLNTKSVASARLHLSFEQRIPQTAYQLHYSTNSPTAGSIVSAFHYSIFNNILTKIYIYQYNFITEL
jgi:hypothetical protein